MTKQLIYDIIAIAVFAVLARFAHPPVTLGGIFDAFWPGHSALSSAGQF